MLLHLTGTNNHGCEREINAIVLLDMKMFIIWFIHLHFENDIIQYYSGSQCCTMCIDNDICLYTIYIYKAGVFLRSTARIMGPSGPKILVFNTFKLSYFICFELK